VIRTPDGESIVVEQRRHVRLALAAVRVVPLESDVWRVAGASAARNADAVVLG
jgi:hypothetical protein